MECPSTMEKSILLGLITRDASPAAPTRHEDWHYPTHSLLHLAINRDTTSRSCNT